MSEATDSNPNLKLVRIVEETTSQENVPTDDTAKLRSLGYDAVLGRPLGFWSALGLNVCHMGFIVEANSQVVLFAYSAPKLFVSSDDETGGKCHKSVCYGRLPRR
jgi:hypothetical protein